VDDVELVHQLQVVAHVGEVARPLAAVAVVREGRSAGCGEDDLALAAADVIGAVARLHAKAARHLRNVAFDQLGIEPHPLVRFVNFGAGRFQDRARRVLHHLDADLAQQLQRGAVDGLDLVGAQHLDRAIAVEGARERQLPDGSLRGAALTPARAGRSGGGGSDGGGGFTHDGASFRQRKRQRQSAARPLPAAPIKLYTASATLSIHWEFLLLVRCKYSYSGTSSQMSKAPPARSMARCTGAG
jgi:hypothetical protein